MSQVFAGWSRYRGCSSVFQSSSSRDVSGRCRQSATRASQGGVGCQSAKPCRQAETCDGEGFDECRFHDVRQYTNASGFHDLSGKL